MLAYAAVVLPAVMLASAALAIAILVLASATVKDLKVDGNAVYSGKTSNGYVTPGELFRSLQGKSLPERFDAAAAGAGTTP